MKALGICMCMWKYSLSEQKKATFHEKICFLNKFLHNQTKIPTFALLRSLDLILNPVNIVVATLFFVYPGGVGIVTKPYDVFGSKGVLMGSNSSIS